MKTCIKQNKKMLHHYKFSNLRLKHDPLETTIVDSVKLLLKIFVLLKSVQISIIGIHTESYGIHNSYLQSISSQKLAVQTKELP